MSFAFMLNSALDALALSKTFSAGGHISIPDFLDRDCAIELHEALSTRQDWAWAINAGGHVYDLGREARDAMTAEQRVELDNRINLAARDGFQFRFSSLRVPDPVSEREPDRDILHAFAEFMRSDPVLDLIRTVTGKTAILFADAQGTAYHPGDFLTGHDDDIEGKNRELAYVMGLTPEWRVEWGGLLLFHEKEGRISGLVPRFNCLNMFALPVLHSVSQVAPFAGGVRYAVTGWMRTAMPA
ncbi:MAG: 2OG-Fe(II) oxygenase family protein [Sphingorhabdus sp.]|uniref:2OG-Fe(II) oxygenase n=1 Tax=Sphingorhabdus sp. TaxID=1902408 RepID=UPI003C861885